MRNGCYSSCIEQSCLLAGDSLLFAAGAFAALGSLNVWAVSGVFITAAILGDAVNYAVGNYLGTITSVKVSVLGYSMLCRSVPARK